MQTTCAVSKPEESSLLTASEHSGEWYFRMISGDDDFPIQMPCDMTENRQGDRQSYQEQG